MRGHARSDVAARLAAHSEPDTNGGCLLWSGYTNRQGYGDTSVRGRTTRAHRAAWELANGPVPLGLHVLHRCDVPACINPAHLWLGTNADNMTDKVAKGRHRNGDVRGEQCAAAKLTAADVRIVKARLATGEAAPPIARDFGVSPEAVHGIKHGRTWKHIA